MPQFPFFIKVSKQICNMVEGSMAEINKGDNILQEKESSLVVGICGTFKCKIVMSLLTIPSVY